MTQGQDNTHDHAADIHQPGPASESDDTQYNWRIHHPFEGVENRVAVEVAPWKGLMPRWRFVVPGDYAGPTRWGVGPAGTGEINENVKRPAKDGPIQMVNGPMVVWFGGHESLSSKQSAYLVFDGEPPHYVAFGQAEAIGGAPGSLEGISFGDHPTHPGEENFDPSHGHEQHIPAPQPPTPPAPAFDPHAGHDHSAQDHSGHDHAQDHAGHDHSAQDHSGHDHAQDHAGHDHSAHDHDDHSGHNH